MTGLTTTLMPTIGRAITRERVKEAAPEEFRSLTDPYRGLCAAIEFRGERSTDDETVRAALEAVSCLVTMKNPEEALNRLHSAVAASLAGACCIDTLGGDDVELAVHLATTIGDELDNAAHATPDGLRSAVLEARREMDAALRRLNQRALLAGRLSMIEQQCVWSRTVLARVPELMHCVPRTVQ
jgi:hypothetical protein